MKRRETFKRRQGSSSLMIGEILAHKSPHKEHFFKPMMQGDAKTYKNEEVMNFETMLLNERV